ncbi:MAG TPA: DUF4351 domain-containing protein, partial [Rhodocyclaceae bacterium]|nr:DUF4351 domain-containing protein [Rhodocyclaceae bacterium]
EGTDMLETNIDRWKAQAIAEGVLLGEQRGEQRGEQAAKRSLLLRTVSRRFKQIPDAIRQRIEQAPVEQIDDWFDRAVDAPSLEEVFGTDDVRH